MDFPEFQEKVSDFWSSENNTESQGYMPESSEFSSEYDDSDLNDQTCEKTAENKHFSEQYNHQIHFPKTLKDSFYHSQLFQRINLHPIESNTQKTTNFETIEILNKYMNRLNLDNHFPLMNRIKISKDKADRATTEQVLDLRTRIILFRLINKGLIYKINGCVSTGKEANVYHAVTEKGEQRAIKVYKTSILIFKNRDRYVSEKELRNLKRLYQAGIPCPEPLYLRMHVLVMNFLGEKDGWPYPRLKDVNLSDSKYSDLYLQLLSYIRIIYQVCHLVHSDLSEYNILYYSKTLYIIDVSQSVEHNHPRSLEFLRMDIANVNNFFRKNGVACLNERAIFDFVISDSGGITKEEIEKTLLEIRVLPECQESKDFKEDIVFKYSYIPQTLDQVRN
ncbi:hypothetical protein PCK2_000384, partial [Pneumocystis canis]